MQLEAKVIEQQLIPKILGRIGIAVSEKAKELVPKDLGTLRNSITYKIHGNSVFIGTNLPYALVMEYGRQPGTMPPPEALAAWCRRHGMAGAEWVIARAIKARGIPVGSPEAPLRTPSGFRPFLRPAVFQSKPLVARLIKEGFKK